MAKTRAVIASLTNRTERDNERYIALSQVIRIRIVAMRPCYGNKLSVVTLIPSWSRLVFALPRLFGRVNGLVKFLDGPHCRRQQRILSPITPQSRPI
jgi:hypothetical protein